MRAWIFVAAAALVSPATADGYKMSKYPENKCGNIRARAMLPFDLLLDAPSDGEIESVDHPKFKSSRLYTKDFNWDVRVQVAKKEDLDFAKAKKGVIAQSKKDGSKLTWKASAKTSDGYKLLFSTEDQDGSLLHVQIYLRTIDKRKWLCTGISEWKDSHECLATACESLRGP